MLAILAILVLIQSCFFIFLSYLRVGTINNPITYFNVWWGIWVSLSTLGFFGLDSLSLNTFSVIFFSNFLLSLGLLIVINKNKNNVKIIKDSVNWSKLNIIQIALSVVLLIFFFRSFTTFITSGLGSGDFRNIYIYGASSIFGNSTIRFLFVNLIKGLMLTFLLLTLSALLIKKRNKTIKFALLLSSLNVLLYTGTMMGRVEIFRLVILYILSVLIFKFIRKNTNHKLKDLKLKVKKRYLILLILILVSLTYFRDTNNTFFGSIITSLEQFFIYFIGPFIAFDKFVSDFNWQSFDIGWGRGFLGGLEMIFNNIISFFVNQDNETYATYLARFTDSRVEIGESQTFNALYTMYFNFFADGQIIGTLICALIFGLIVGLVYNYSINNISIYSFSIYLYLAHMLIFGSLYWPLEALGDWLVVINIFLIYIVVEKFVLKENKT